MLTNIFARFTRKPRAFRWLFMFSVGMVFVSAFLALRLYKAVAFRKQVEHMYQDLLENQQIRYREFRPSGGFEFSIIGEVRGPNGYGSATLSSTLLQQATQYDIDDARLHHLLGTLYFFNRNLDMAEAHYRRALQRTPKNAKVINDLALVYIKQGDYEQALNQLQQAIASDPRLLEARYNLALVYEFMGDTSRAAQAWREYLEVDDDPTSNWKNVAKSRITELAY